MWFFKNKKTPKHKIDPKIDLWGEKNTKEEIDEGRILQIPSCKKTQPDPYTILQKILEFIVAWKTIDPKAEWFRMDLRHHQMSRGDPYPTACVHLTRDGYTNVQEELLCSRHPNINAMLDEIKTMIKTYPYNANITTQDGALVLYMLDTARVLAIIDTPLKKIHERRTSLSSKISYDALTDPLSTDTRSGDWLIFPQSITAHQRAEAWTRWQDINGTEPTGDLLVEEHHIHEWIDGELDGPLCQIIAHKANNYVGLTYDRSYVGQHAELLAVIPVGKDLK